jgi:hypothetical protein
MRISALSRCNRHNSDALHKGLRRIRPRQVADVIQLALRQVRRAKSQAQRQIFATCTLSVITELSYAAGIL